MNESPVAQAWRAEAFRKGEIKGKLEGKLEGKAEMLVRALQRRLGSMPDDLIACIQGCEDSEQLERWMDLAVTAATLEEFRRQAGL